MENSKPEKVKTVSAPKRLGLEFSLSFNKMPNSCIMPSFLEEDIEIYRYYVMTIIKYMTELNAKASFRVWINNTLNQEYSVRVKNTTPLDGESIQEWSDRVFAKQKFGIIINDVQSYCPDLNARVLDIIQPIIDQNEIPSGGFEMTLFIGNYGFTPLGVHRDFTGGKVIHFHLGPGNKVMYQWDDNIYQKVVGGAIVCHEPEKITQYASKYEFKSGDLFFMSEDTWHIGQSDELSVGLALWFNNNTRDKAFNDICHDINNNILDNNLSIMPSIPFSKFELKNEMHFIFNMEDRYKSLSVEQFFNELYKENQMRILSNGGFANRSLKRDSITISMTGSIKLIKPYQIFVQILVGNTVYIYARGHQLEFPYHPALLEIVNKINSACILSIESLMKPMLQDWSEEVVIYLVDLLHSHEGIDYIDN